MNQTTKVVQFHQYVKHSAKLNWIYERAQLWSER